MQLEKWQRFPYEGWRVNIIWEGAVIEQNLFWEEVERFEKSDFERWKFIKSIISGVGHTSLTTVHEAERRGWVRFRKDGRLIEVNLDEACDAGHVRPHAAKKAAGPASAADHPDIR